MKESRIDRQVDPNNKPDGEAVWLRVSEVRRVINLQWFKDPQNKRDLLARITTLSIRRGRRIVRNPESAIEEDVVRETPRIIYRPHPTPGYFDAGLATKIVLEGLNIDPSNLTLEQRQNIKTSFLRHHYEPPHL
jgi:hypothetical protein